MKPKETISSLLTGKKTKTKNLNIRQSTEAKQYTKQLLYGVGVGAVHDALRTSSVAQTSPQLNCLKPCKQNSSLKGIQTVLFSLNTPLRGRIFLVLRLLELFGLLPRETVGRLILMWLFGRPLL